MLKYEQGGTQGSVLSEGNVSTAGSEVAGVMGRIKRHHSEMRKARDPDSAINPEQVLKQMMSNGYPPRAVERVRSGMWGPGLEKAQSLLPMIQRGGAIIIAHGDRGPGKTQMATWWAYQRGMSAKSVGRYIKALDLLKELKATWGNSSKLSEQQALMPYLKARFLVLDEIQERPSENGLVEWSNQTITNLIDRRYDAMLDTVLIGNFSRKELSAIIPASIVSRAEECGGSVLCDWPSYRKSNIQ